MLKDTGAVCGSCLTSQRLRDLPNFIIAVYNLSLDSHIFTTNLHGGK